MGCLGHPLRYNPGSRVLLPGKNDTARAALRAATCRMALAKLDSSAAYVKHVPNTFRMADQRDQVPKNSLRISTPLSDLVVVQQEQAKLMSESSLVEPDALRGDFDGGPQEDVGACI